MYTPAHCDNYSAKQWLGCDCIQLNWTEKSRGKEGRLEISVAGKTNPVWTPGQQGKKAKTQAAAAEHKVSQLPKHLGQQRELVIEHLASQCANFVSGQPFHVQAVQRIIIKEAIEPIYMVRVT